MLAFRGFIVAFWLLLAPVALFGGIGFLMPYLLYLSFTTKGDIRQVLVGVGRAA